MFLGKWCQSQASESMAEGNKHPAVDDEWSLENLWVTQNQLAQKLEDLTQEFAKSAREWRKDIQSL